LAQLPKKLIFETKSSKSIKKKGKKGGKVPRHLKHKQQRGKISL
jgi:hypothetical protein